ncbi:MAG: hypothetical protein IJF67_06175 [Clostridia bacterium]|nr:hypothetical protein [Clostridia bacterium]
MMMRAKTHHSDVSRERIKKLVLAWDPDFTRVTAEEAMQIAAAENSGFVDEDEIDWDSIGQS